MCTLSLGIMASLVAANLCLAGENRPTATAATAARLADKEPSPKKKAYKGKPAARMVYYSGKVQGVGFRATTEAIAQDYPVTGWVKNLKDGRVQLLVEGPTDAVDDFLQAVRTRWKRNIDKEQSEKQAVTGKYDKFMVAY
jgi:acylphosphatase